METTLKLFCQSAQSLLYSGINVKLRQSVLAKYHRRYFNYFCISRAALLG